MPQVSTKSAKNTTAIRNKAPRLYLCYLNTCTQYQVLVKTHQWLLGFLAGCGQQQNSPMHM